jgi:hypothetical protein
LNNFSSSYSLALKCFESDRNVHTINKNHESVIYISSAAECLIMIQCLRSLYNRDSLKQKEKIYDNLLQTYSEKADLIQLLMNVCPFLPASSAAALLDSYNSDLLAIFRSNAQEILANSPLDRLAAEEIERMNETMQAEAKL